jgi:hypothetical protein
MGELLDLLMEAKYLGDIPTCPICEEVTGETKNLKICTQCQIKYFQLDQE